MGILDEIILESNSKKTWFACISATTWGSIWGSVTSLGIPWGHINRTTSAVAEPSLKEAVLRWIKHNNFIKHVLVEGNTVYVDPDWYDKEKTTAVVILQAPEGSTFKGVFSDRNISSPYVQHGGVIFKGGAIAPKSMKTNFAKVTGIKSMETTFEQALRKAGLKIKTMDTGINPTGPINAWKKFNGWESSDMYTDREVREILEQVYAEAYDQGIDDTLDYIDENYEIEDDSFDLEDEYDVYTEMLSSGLKQHIRIYGKNLEKQGITGQDKTDLIKGKIANVYQHRLKDDSAPFEHKSGRTYDIGYKVGEKVDNKLAANKKLSDADKKASEDANRKTYRRGVYDPEKMY